MKPKRYRVVDGVLRFENGVTSFEDYLTVPEGVIAIDFNELEHITKPLRLSDTQITEIDFKNLITVDNVYLPKKIKIIENLYWADKFIFPQKNYMWEIIKSPRLKYLNVYNDRPLVYLSATVVNYLEKRAQQRDELLNANYAVYSPGTHMTLGDPVADKYPSLVADIDIKAMEKADVILFDLTNLSAGTCAELGYAIAKGWHKEKRLYYLWKDTTNFFIKGLVREITRVDSIEDFVKRDKLWI